MINKIKGESKRKSLVPFLLIASLGSLLIVLVLSWYLFDVAQFQKKSDSEKLEKLPLDNSLAESTGEADNFPLTVEKVVEMVSRHILLTEGEITVVTITDIENLRQESQGSAILFQYAKNGDKLLFYDNGIIIYDPVLDKIVDVLRRLPGGADIPSKP